jgi:ADP-heptose:LPS heptosyltransferase
MNSTTVKPTSQSPVQFSSAFVRYLSAAYLRGRGVSFGVGNDPIYPAKAVDMGKYSVNVDVGKMEHVDVLDSDMSIIARDSCDHVFVGARENPPFKELISKLKLGGHLIVHSVAVDPDIYRKLLSDFGVWKEKETLTHNGQFVGIWKYMARSGKGRVEPPAPVTQKRACIARYGAIGDMIILSPLIRKLHEDGYAVTLNITPYCAEVVRHNPYVSNIVIQERDVIPNPELGEYWNFWIPRYDKYINLSESVEGSLLKVEGRRDFYTTKNWRNELCSDTNYFDNTMRLGGYPTLTGSRGELYFSHQEQKDAKRFKAKIGVDRFCIMWALKGSSYHKIYPLLEPVLTEFLRQHPNATVLLVGAASDAQLQFNHPQVIPLAGEISLREVFSLIPHMDVVVGPETAITNAAGCTPVPKITMLSHSSHTNLCKYWENDYCLQAEAACSPCNQLHYTMESCPRTEIRSSKDGTPFWQGPTCATTGFPPQRVLDRLNEVYGLWANRLQP